MEPMVARRIITLYISGAYSLPLKMYSLQKVITRTFQGGPLSSLMFKVCGDAVIREWLHWTLGEDAARDGIGDRMADG